MFVGMCTQSLHWRGTGRDQSSDQDPGLGSRVLSFSEIENVRTDQDLKVVSGLWGIKRLTSTAHGRTNPRGYLKGEEVELKRVMSLKPRWFQGEETKAWSADQLLC